MLNIGKVASTEHSAATTNATAKIDEENSFESRLEAAQKELEKKYETEALIPWAAVEGMFNAILSSLDSELKISSFSPADSDYSSGSAHYFQTAEINPSATNPSATDANAVAAISNEEENKNQQATLEQTIIRVNLAGSPFFVNALWEAGFSNLASSKISLEALISKLIDQAKLLKNGERKTLEVLLSPKELGKIMLTVTKTEGAVNIQIFAAESAKTILDKNISSLEESLKNANINIGSLTVSVGRRHQDGEKAHEEESTYGNLTWLPKEIDTASASISVDSYLVKKLLGWLPKLSVYSKV
jgi:flagellar hook-length control protein FliK